MRNQFTRVIATVMCFVLLACAGQFSALAAGKTGVGMAEWALRAYNEGWKYVFGGSEVGSIDCSGLIRSYTKAGGGALALLNASAKSGDISSMPNIHGLGLWCDGHAGVYVGKNDSGVNMAVDARNSRVNVVYSTMDSRSWNPWVKWFKVDGVTYPTTGWESYNGKQYYYYGGEFVTGVFIVDGVSYDFGKSGALIGVAQPTTTTTATVTTTTTTTTTKAQTTTTTVRTTTTTAAKTTTRTTATAYSGALKPGMRGEEVAKMQRRLIELGYMDAKATGYFGNHTEIAVKAFQRAVSLAPDGIVGSGTKSKLFASDAPRMTTSTATTTTVTTTTTTTTAPATTTTATTATTQTGSVNATTTTAASTSQSQTTPVTTAATTTTCPSSPIDALLNMDADEYNSLYAKLEFGSSGSAVKELQRRLTDLGYYDSEIDGYYGVFLRIAVKSFQLSAGITETGVADAETQALLYSQYAPVADDTLYQSEAYISEEYQQDEGDYYAEDSTVQQPVQLEASSGLSAYSTKANISSFTRRFGSGGALQTLGITSYAEPIVIIVYNGDSFELTDELQRVIDSCVFF